MEESLYGPGGFYEGTPVGERGHFVTSPHVHAIYSRLVGAAVEALWEGLGRPLPLRLVELGAGDGTMGRELVDGFARAGIELDYAAVELSPGARASLEAAGLRVLGTIGEIAPLAPASWSRTSCSTTSRSVASGCDAASSREVRVGLEESRLIEVESPCDEELRSLSPPLEDGAETTVPTGALALRRRARLVAPRRVRAADRLRQLAPARPARCTATGSTGWSSDVLADPGSADITAGVDLGVVAARAEALGFEVHGPVRQSSALAALGFERVDARRTRPPGRAAERRPRHGRRPGMGGPQPRAPARRSERARSAPVAPAGDGGTRRAGDGRRAPGPSSRRSIDPSSGTGILSAAAPVRSREVTCASVGLRSRSSSSSRCSWCSPRRARGASPPRTPRRRLRGRRGEVDEGLEAELEEQQEGDGAAPRGAGGRAPRPAPSASIERIAADAGAGLGRRADREPTRPTTGSPPIAADPNAPFVYILHNRYGASRPAANGCPDPAMILHVSKDGGRTWRPERFLCRCEGVKGQFDPLIEVVPDTGDVVRGVDERLPHPASRARPITAATWSKPVWIHPDVRWGDKPNLAVSPDGQDVYVLFNGPTGGDVYAAVSHDAGATWSTVTVTERRSLLLRLRRHRAARRAGRLRARSASRTRDPATRPRACMQIHLIAPTTRAPRGPTLVVDELELGTECTSRSCYGDFYDSGPVARRGRGRRPRHRLQRRVGAARTADRLLAVVDRRRPHLERPRARSRSDGRQRRVPGRGRGRRRRGAPVVHGPAHRPVERLVHDDDGPRARPGARR